MSECVPGCPCGENPLPEDFDKDIEKILVIEDDYGSLPEEFFKAAGMGHYPDHPEPKKLEAAEAKEENSAQRDKRVARLNRLRERRRGRALRCGETE